MIKINTLKSLVATDLIAVDETMLRYLKSDIEFIEELSGHVVKSGGKRLRPLLVLLASHALDYEGKAHIEVAAIIELLHTTTLLHDDVVDDSGLRRGQQTANAIWGNKASVLVGDVLLSRALQMMVHLKTLQFIDVFAKATHVLSKGEVIQLINCHNPDVDEATYMQVIRAKTASLFEAAAHLAAIITNSSQTITQAMLNYGEHIGTAFQLVDDLLDYTADKNQMGKNSGDDLAEGKATLPMIYAIRKGNSTQQAFLRQALREGDVNCMDEIKQILHDLGAINYTKELAQHQANQAKDALVDIPDSKYREALFQFADYAAQRTL